MSLNSGQLTLSHPKQTRSIIITFREVSSLSSSGTKEKSIQTSSSLTSDEITQWLESVLGVKCFLVANEGCPVDKDNISSHEKSQEQEIEFTNSGGVSLLSSTSIERLSCSLESSGSCGNVTSHRFRMNLIVDIYPMAPNELEWKDFCIGGCEFKTKKGCKRCNIVMVNHENGTKDGLDVFLAIARGRISGAAPFGVIVDSKHDSVLSVGDVVVIKGLQ